MAIRIVLALAGLAMTPVTLRAEVVGEQVSAEPISESRIAALPPEQRAAWLAYLRRSAALLKADRAALAAERAAGGPIPPPAPPGRAGENMPLEREPGWYASAEARRVADNIVSFQTPAGGWGKNQDRAAPARLPGQAYVAGDRVVSPSDVAGDSGWSFVGTLDNDATTTELRFLARVQAALPGREGDLYRAAFLKGLRYLLAAQFPNGGWPQVFPLQGGYHDALTFNDDAMLHATALLAAVGEGQGDYGFVPAALRAEARAGAGRALDVILASQVKVDGKRTIWAQQHDALTLAPVGARNFEPAALSSAESASILLFLMARPHPSPAVAAAIRDGIAWLEAHGLRDVAWGPGPEGRRLAPAPGAGPIWARFYDMRTFRPIFGDRDRSIHDDVNEISLERRNGYSWFNTSPRKAIEVYAKR